MSHCVVVTGNQDLTVLGRRCYQVLCHCVVVTSDLLFDKAAAATGCVHSSAINYLCVVAAVGSYNCRDRSSVDHNV